MSKTRSNRPILKPMKPEELDQVISVSDKVVESAARALSEVSERMGVKHTDYQTSGTAQYLACEKDQ